MSSMIPILSNSKALECNMLVIRRSEIRSRKFRSHTKAVLFLISLQESRKWHYTILDGVIQLQLTCMKVACLRFELVDTGNQQSNKEVDWQRVKAYSPSVHGHTHTHTHTHSHSHSHSHYAVTSKWKCNIHLHMPLEGLYLYL